MTSERKIRHDGAAGQLHIEEQAGLLPSIPEGFEALTPPQRLYWDSYGTTRLLEDWRLIDRVNLYQLAKVSVAYAVELNLLISEGGITPDSTGGIKANPRGQTIDKLHRQVIAYQRMLGLSQHEIRPRTMNDRGKLGQEKAQRNETLGKKTGITGLA